MRKIVALFVVVVVVVAAWTGGWFWLRGTVLDGMDRALADFASKGAEVTCPDRSATGWPFRLEIACTKPQMVLRDGRRVEAAAFAATWHVVDPKLVVAAVLSPLVITASEGSASLTFESLRGSLRTEDMRSGVVAVEATRPGLTATLAGADGPVADAAADAAELHFRPTADLPGSWDLAVTAWGFTGRTGGSPLLPAPADAGLDLSLSRLDLLDGTQQGARDWAAAGGALTLREATLVVGETRITAAGTGAVDAEGKPTATLDATATRIDWLTKQAKEGTPLPPALAALGSAFLLLGRPVEGEGSPRALTVAVDAGAVTANGLSIGTLPPLFAGP